MAFNRTLSLLGFMFFALLTACKQPDAVKHLSLPKENEIDSLVVLGGKVLNSNKDSINKVANRLGAISAATGNKKALVYGELFSAQYLWLMSSHEQSMAEAVKSLADAEKWNITTAFPEIYGLIGNLHKENTNYQLAFDAQEKGLSWARINKDTTQIIWMLGLRAMFIHTLRQTVNSPAEKDSSLVFYLKALDLAQQEPKYEPLRIPIYDNLSQFYLDDFGNYKQAIYYADQGITLAKKYHRLRSLTYGYTVLGRAYFKSGNKRKGFFYMDKALAIARAIKEPYRVMELNQDIANYYALTGNYKKAYALSQLATAMHDSLQVNINERQVSELQIKYESAKKEKELMELDHAALVKNRQLLVVLGGSLLGITLTIILILQYRVISRHNKLIKISNKRKDHALANIAFIQAHELRRPVASIMGIINVIKAMEYEFDPECIDKLDKAAEELDQRIHSVLSHVEAQSEELA